jgi:hypothetical protein
MAKHDERPQHGDLPEAEMNRALARVSGSYGQHVHALLNDIHGKVVDRTSVGRSGYCLEFKDGSWVICYLSSAVLEWRTGPGAPSAVDRALMDSPHAGDGRGPLPVEHPYADEVCDLEAEVARAAGQPVTGVAVGETSFNLCFPDGRELDATVLSDPDGRPVLRVFWEQW